jgi:hypothetical protein
MRARLTLPTAFGVLLVAIPLFAQVPPPPPPPPSPPPSTNTTARPQAPQAPPRDVAAPVQRTGTGVIRGRVVDAATGEPIRRAILTLNAPGGLQPLPTAVTDLEGRYEFTRLAANRYNLFAQKRSYLFVQYGQRRARQPGKPVDLTDGQTLEHVDLALPKAGVIAGRILDDLGEAVDSVFVLAMRMQFYQGQRRLVPAAARSVQLDDLGRYRIPGLAPGTYYIATVPLGSMVTDDRFVFGQTFYPGTPDRSQAQPIVLKVGQEVLNADFNLVPSRAARVSGTVVSSRGQPVAGATIQTSQAISGPSGGGVVLGGSTVRTAADGTFTLATMWPGEHSVHVSATNTDTGEHEELESTLTVSGIDFDNLTLQLTAGVRVTGRIRFDSGSDPGFLPTRLTIGQIQTVIGIPSPTPRFSSTVRPDGTFELKGVDPGPRMLRVGGFPVGWGLKAILHQGRDVTDTPLDIAPNQDLDGVEIVVTNRVTELSGAVADDQGQPVKEYSLVVFPEDSTKWLEGSRLLATARPDQNGRFTVRALPPGRYFAVALEYVEAGASNDPEFLAAVRDQATRFTIAEGEKKTLDLKIVRVDGAPSPQAEGGRR